MKLINLQIWDIFLMGGLYGLAFLLGRKMWSSLMLPLKFWSSKEIHKVDRAGSYQWHVERMGTYLFLKLFNCKGGLTMTSFLRPLLWNRRLSLGSAFVIHIETKKKNKIVERVNLIFTIVEGAPIFGLYKGLLILRMG